jgi:uncharacterized cupredoxin-like copper-binding protein
MRLVSLTEKRLVSFASLALVGAVLLAACGSEAAEEEGHDVTRVPVTYEAAAQPSPGEGGGEEGGGETASTEVTVDMVDIAFAPTEFSIPAGVEVTINLTNSGAAVHDFTIEALGIHEVLDPGGETSFTLTADAGDFDYVCTQPGHKEAGMVGVMHAVEGGGEATGGASPVASPGASPIASPVAEEAAGGEAEATAVTMDMVDIAFDPTEFSIPAGTDVEVTLTNSGAAVHDFTIEELGIHEVLDPGGETTFTINADAGDYDYICTQPGHKEAGMVGVMTVQ